MVYETIEHSIGEYTYLALQEHLTPKEIARFISEIQESERYILEDLGRILLRDTQVVVGYIGDDKVDLVDTHDTSLFPNHNSLIDILSKCLERDD